MPVNIPPGPGLELFGGVITGMTTLGLMSLAVVDFEALISSCSPQDRIHAVKINDWNSGEKLTGSIDASTSTRVKFQVSKNVKFGQSTHFQPCRMRSLTHTTRMQSASSICAAALSTRCSTAVQTRPVTRRPSTQIKAPPIKGEMKAPRIDNSGPGLPPRDGGGGGHWSGGFFLFGFVAFLAFLKERENEGDYSD